VAARWPTSTALGLLSIGIAILSLPMWAGQYLAGPWSDQFSTGWAIRHWGAEQWRATGRLPVWNPEMLGGVPTVAGFGDQFYPSAWLRLVLPTTISVDLAFVGHYLLAGLFFYLLLRLLGTSWLGSVVGATAYQLSGPVISYVSPGHDGQLFVAALFPLMLIGLVLGIRRRRLEGHALLGLAVGLALLSPHYQATQYALIAAGVFALYLTVGEAEGLTPAQRWRGLGLALAGVLLGFGVSLIQLLPFLHYIPFSPRGGVKTFEWATSYAVPWIHLPEVLVSGFMGFTPDATYWGPNDLKLQSAYLGLPVVALAVLGATGGEGLRRRLARWMLAIGALFLLVALGSGTPFYRLWWAVVPFVNKTRAPEIALYLVAFAAAVLAALGVERLERGEGKRWAIAGVIAGGLCAVLALVGTFGGIALSYAQAHQEDIGVELVRAAAAAQPGILWGALASGVALVVVAGVAFSFQQGRLTAPVFAGALVLLLGADLWRSGRGFWRWSRPESRQVASDDLIRRLALVPPPLRVSDYGGVYPSDALMAHGIPAVGGYHGNELQAYDELLGAAGADLGRSLRLWKLLAVRYVISADTARIPGFHEVLGPVRTGMGRQAYLYEADSAPPYVRVVPAAVRTDSSQVVAALFDPRTDYDRVVLFTPDQPVPASALAAPQRSQPSSSRASVTQWAPGRMRVSVTPAPTTASYLVVSENWYKDWRASVDGQAAPVLRGDQTLITVPIGVGTRDVELRFEPRDYRTGKRVTLVSLILLLGMGLVPPALRRASFMRTYQESRDVQER
jgi:hypothetical protein